MISEAVLGDRYRFGFNGAERLDELKGYGNTPDLGDRFHDARLARMNWKTDRREADYPWQSPYAYYANSPIWKLDFNGEGGITEQEFVRKAERFYRKNESTIIKVVGAVQLAGDVYVGSVEALYGAAMATTTAPTVGGTVVGIYITLDGVTRIISVFPRAAGLFSDDEELENVPSNLPALMGKAVDEGFEVTGNPTETQRYYQEKFEVGGDLLVNKRKFKKELREWLTSETTVENVKKAAKVLYRGYSLYKNLKEIVKPEKPTPSVEAGEAKVIDIVPDED